MAETAPLRPSFTVHGAGDIAAVVDTAAALGAAVRILSAPGASASLGPAWFARAVQAPLARARAAGIPVEAFLDCADHAGEAMAALREPVPGVIFTGAPEAADKLAAIASAQGVAFRIDRPVSHDLAGCSDPAAAVRARLAAA